MSHHITPRRFSPAYSPIPSLMVGNDSQDIQPDLNDKIGMRSKQSTNKPSAAGGLENVQQLQNRPTLPQRLDEHEWAHTKDQHSHEVVSFRKLSWLQKLGKTAIAVLFIGDAAILLCLGLLAFLWFSDTRNPIWRAVVTRDWMTKAITIISEAIKLSAGLQIGTCSAMLAALALERFEVELRDAASIALLRANVLGSSSILGLSRHVTWLCRMINRRRWMLPLCIVIILAIFAFLQAVTVILVSDLSLVQLPARSSVQSTPYSLQYTSTNQSNIPQSGLTERTTTWLRKPQDYPAFAEHREDLFSEDGVDDTGLTIRAFLPFRASSNRENINEYTGKATVLDNRVTCQRPNLDQLIAQYDTLNSLIMLNGTISASRQTPRMNNKTVTQPYGVGFSGWIHDAPISFSCVAPTESALKHFEPVNGQHRMAICQLGEGGGFTEISGGLTSEFLNSANLTTTDPPPSQEQGAAYILLNVTLGDSSHWQAVTETGAKPPQVSAHGPWEDLVYSDASLILSVSLCYTAFNTAELPVHMSSIANRTEPLPFYDIVKQVYHFDTIREQYGQDRSMDSLQRGTMDLAPVRGSWLAQPDELPPQEPWLRSSANMIGTANNFGNDPNLTAVMFQSSSCSSTSVETFNYATTGNFICPDSMHILLFQEILQSGGSPAFALQTLISSLANLAYYDQLPQFDKSDQVVQRYFMTSNAAVRHIGFIVVASVLTVHLLMVIVCLILFLVGSKWSRLGNTWCAISQLVTTQAVDFWEQAANGLSDSHVEKHLGDEKRDKLRVGIDQDRDGKVGLLKLKVP